MVGVLVDGLPLEPAGNLRDAEQRFELHPKALLGVGWNSLPLVPPSPSSDSRAGYARGLAGAVLRYHPHPLLEAALDAELERLVYREVPVLDTSLGKVRADVAHQTVETDVRGDVGWVRAQNCLLETGEPVVSDFYQARSDLRHDSRWWWEELHAGASFLNYRQATRSFDEVQGDHATYDLGVKYGILQGDERCFVGLRGQLVRYPDPGRFNNDEALTATIGGRKAVLASSEIHAEIGWAGRRYTDNYLQDPRHDDRIATAPWGDVGLRWSWRDEEYLALRLFSELGDSVISNATWNLGGDVLWHMPVGRRCALDATAGWSQGRDGGWNSDATTLQLRVRQATIAGQYQVTEGLAARLRTSCISVDSTTSDSYRRAIVALDLAYAY